VKHSRATCSAYAPQRNLSCLKNLPKPSKHTHQCMQCTPVPYPVRTSQCTCRTTYQYHHTAVQRHNITRTRTCSSASAAMKYILPGCCSRCNMAPALRWHGCASLRLAAARTWCTMVSSRVRNSCGLKYSAVQTSTVQQTAMRSTHAQHSTA
jgi:hypothetical protein